MPNTITVKLDVTLIDKARLFVGKTNAKGHTPKYLDLVLIPRKEVGQYGATHICKQSITKAEREAKVEMPILGDATERGAAPAQQAPTASAPAPSGGADDEGSIPF